MPGEPTREPTYSEFVISSLNVRTNRMEAQANGRRSVAERESGGRNSSLGSASSVRSFDGSFVCTDVSSHNNEQGTGGGGQ